MSEKEISEICIRYGIDKYTINSDGSIDVHDDVYLSRRGLVKIPIRFNKIFGYFDCSENDLISLEGCPEYISDWFDCSFNNLTSLIGGPSVVKSWFDSTQNNITSLEGCPSMVEILFISNNNLKSLDGINIPYSKLDHFIGIEKLIRKHKLSNYLKL